MNTFASAIFVSLLFFGACRSADFKETIRHVSQLPPELQCKILCSDAVVKTHIPPQGTQKAHGNGGGSIILLPATQPIINVDFFSESRSLWHHGGKYNVITPFIHGQGQSASLSVVYWENEQIQYSLTLPPTDTVSFEGYNKNRCGCFVLHNELEDAIAILTPGMLDRDSSRSFSFGIPRSDYRKTYGYVYLVDGAVTALSLHTDANRIAFAVYNFMTGRSQIRISDIGVFRGNIDKSIVTDKALCEVPYVCNKIVHLGEQSYALVAQDGQLRLFEQYEKNIKIYDQSHGALRFKNIAVNREYTNIKRGKFRCALLSEQGDLYVADLWSLKKPTLFYVFTLPDAALVYNIYYEGDEFKIVYQAVSDPQLITKIDVYKDNYMLLWLREFMRQYRDEIAKQ